MPDSHRLISVLTRIGKPFTWAMHLGLWSVKGPIRLPIPAARMIAFLTEAKDGVFQELYLALLRIYPSFLLVTGNKHTVFA